jgi:hypothetical protein
MISGMLADTGATRATWARLTDRQLLEQCEVDTYRASGPGGQKRNKTSSAVRLRHLPSGLIVIAEESRSQHENKARALRRLRKQLYLKLREPVPPANAADLLEAMRERHLKLGLKDERFWPAAGVALDAVFALEARVSEAAGALGVLTSHLVAFLASEPKVWEQANLLRRQFGQKPLRIGE